MLYTYCIPFDNGSAPNPFWGRCSLAICKPVIRRCADLGDWIVGTGSAQYGFEGKVVYAMEVTEIMTMQEYDAYCKRNMPQKIPHLRGKSYRDRVGDCIYDFDIAPPAIRPSVHNEINRKRDLGGLNVLLSDHFYYFGDKPQALPFHLLPIVNQGQGHKSKSNQLFFQEFLAWILGQTQARNRVFSEPKDRHLFILDNDYIRMCSSRNEEEDELDEIVGCE